MSAALRELLVELREGRADYDGRMMPDRAEPFGIDCGVLRRAEEAIDTLLAKSAAYEALVAGCSELAAKLDRQAAENYTDRGNALSRCADDIRLLLVREGEDGN